MTRRVVALLSGGIDSLVCAESARLAGELIGCVFVDYGHPAQVVEGWKAFAYCGSRGVALKVPHVRDLDLGEMSAGHGARVVPHRNAILIATAANAAASMRPDAILIGCNRADQADYADCRPAFLQAISAAIGVEVRAPLIDKSKAEIIALAGALGFNSLDAWSCYGPGPDPCNACPSCEEAAQAWERAYA